MENKNIIKALMKVQELVKPVEKNQNNPFFHSRYADLTAVIEPLRPILLENGLFVSQTGVDVGGKFYLRTTVWHESGESFVSDYLIASDYLVEQASTQADDASGKDTKKASNKVGPQAIASAWTYARRKAYEGIFCLCTADDDGEGAENRVHSTPTQAKSYSTTTTGSNVSKFQTISEKQGKMLYAIWNQNGKTKEEVLEYLNDTFGYTDTRQITRRS